MTGTQLIPMRFIVMIGHLILLILFLSDQNNKGKYCIRWNDAEDKEVSDEYKVVIGLSISIALIVIEFFGFLSGVSMFFPSQNLFSLLSHACGCILFSYFITEVWHCSIYWYIFTCFSVLPFLTEILIILRVLVFKLPF